MSSSSSSSTEQVAMLFKCVPSRFTYLPRSFRILLGQIIFAMFGLLFLAVPLNVGILLLALMLGMTKVTSIATAVLGFQVLQFLIPCQEW